MLSVIIKGKQCGHKYNVEKPSFNMLKFPENIFKGVSVMKIVIDLSKSVYEICKEHPEVVTIMKDLGFENITNPGKLQTAGRFMTIPKGATMKHIPMEKIKEAFAAKGYELKD